MNSRDRSTNASERNNWCNESVVQYGFNLPSVGENLDRLVDTNVIRMTDYNFMMELRKIIWDDYDRKIAKRIENRKNLEIEREKKLILQGRYSHYNCPQQLIPLHSAVLALHLRDNETPLKTKLAEQYETPVFHINKKTNLIVRNRRLKLKSIRHRNLEYLIHHIKLEGNDTANIQCDVIRDVIEDKIKNIEESKMKRILKKFLDAFTNKFTSAFQPKKETNQLYQKV